MAFVTVYDNASGTIDNATADFQTSVFLPDSIYEKWAQPDPDPYYPFEYQFCLGPGCKTDWSSGNGLWVQMYSTTGGWLDLAGIYASYGSTHVEWPFGPAYEPHYTNGNALNRSSNSPWLFGQTVEFRIINKLQPIIFGPFGISTPGPSSLSFSGLTFTIGDQCPPPRAYDPPPPATTYTKHARGLALPYGYMSIFDFLGDDGTPLPSTGGTGSVTIIG